MTFDGTDVKFYVDDSLIHTHTATVTSGLYGYASVYDGGEDVTIQLQAQASGTTAVFIPPPYVVHHI